MATFETNVLSFNDEKVPTKDIQVEEVEEIRIEGIADEAPEQVSTEGRAVVEVAEEEVPEEVSNVIQFGVRGEDEIPENKEWLKTGEEKKAA